MSFNFLIETSDFLLKRLNSLIGTTGTLSNCIFEELILKIEQMKLNVIKILVPLFILTLNFNCQSQISNDDLQQLVGTWKLDMTPQDKTDNNFAMMSITKINENSVEGEFYRTSVPIQDGRVNTQRGIIYVALISGDNSGTYNSSFYYEDGVLYGSTHAVKRGFLAVWTATKTD